MKKNKPDNNLVLLRYTGKNGRRLAALCRPEEGRETLLDILDSDCQFSDTENVDGSVVTIATDGLVVIDSAEDLTLLAWWLSLAAAWLKKRGG